MSSTHTSSFRWLPNGQTALEGMLAAIQASRESVRLETYICTDCPIGHRFREALADAARRGVRVRVLIDALGSFTLSTAYWNALVEAGGEFKWFNPISAPRWSYRDHRKILVCDQQVAFIGGFNISSEYNGDGVTFGWRDLGLEVAGPLVKELAETFDVIFANADFQHRFLQRLRKRSSRITQELRRGGSNVIPSGPNSKLLLGGPGMRHGTIKQILASDLSRAGQARIMSGYFLPTRRIRKELVRICHRGGQVKLILAGKSDVRLSQLASRRLYTRFLRGGVKIYEYEPQILHAKLFIIDHTVYAGSANLDLRSLNINYELLVRIYDPTLAAEANQIFEDDLNHCRPIDLATWRRSRSFCVKLMERWAYFVLARIDPYIARRQLERLR